MTPQRRLVVYAEANGVPYLDLATVFMEYCDTPGRDPRELFIDGWHLSATGHEATAVSLVEFLEDERLIER